MDLLERWFPYPQKSKKRFKLNPELRDQIDAKAKPKGISRTQLIVNALTAYMEKDGE